MRAHALSDNEILNLKRLVTQSDTTTVRLRGAFQLLPAQASEVSLVGADSICSRAARAFAREMGTRTSAEPVWVIRAGANRYVVTDGLSKSGDRHNWLVFDRAFSYLVIMVDG